jgi:hypothetical protein
MLITKVLFYFSGGIDSGNFNGNTVDVDKLNNGNAISEEEELSFFSEEEENAEFYST